MHGEVQARCREEVCSSAVCWLVARCSRFRTRCSLLSPPSSVALLECGESTPSSELTHSVVGPLSPAAIRRTAYSACGACSSACSSADDVALRGHLLPRLGSKPQHHRLPSRTCLTFGLNFARKACRGVYKGVNR